LVGSEVGEGRDGIRKGPQAWTRTLVSQRTTAIEVDTIAHEAIGADHEAILQIAHFVFNNKCTLIKKYYLAILCTKYYNIF